MSTMTSVNQLSRMKFYCDTDRCIDCNGCSIACAEAHELPANIQRRKVITLNEGIFGQEVSTSIACMHCNDAPCSQVCPVDCFYTREDGVVLHNKNTCIGCGYCLYACPFGAPQFPREGIFQTKGVMDKCTMCAGGPLETNSEEERHLYGQNRISEGKVPVCAAMCSTKALLVGESEEISNIALARMVKRGQSFALNDTIIWKIAYETKRGV